jgi:hypothetical protein
MSLSVTPGGYTGAAAGTASTAVTAITATAINGDIELASALTWESGDFPREHSAAEPQPKASHKLYEFHEIGIRGFLFHISNPSKNVVKKTRIHPLVYTGHGKSNSSVETPGWGLSSVSGIGSVCSDSAT